MAFSIEGKRIWVAGHRGMVGGAVCRRLEQESCEIITVSRDVVELTNQQAVHDWMLQVKPDAIILAAAKVGGIHANNTYPVDFLYENLMIEANIIHAAFLSGVRSLLFLGSSCIYPKESEQPIKEDKLLTGPLETTNEPYAVAKIAGIKLCESYNRQHKRDYRCVMPCNLYGLNDNYHPENSHVIPALIRRFHEAKINEIDSVEVWGTGRPLREFLFSTDLARACIHVMGISKEKWRNKVSKNYSHLNIGSGTDISIENLTSLISSEIGFKGDIIYNSEKPDGTIKKLLDSSLINSIGWMPEVSMQEGIRMAYKDFLNK